MTLAGLVGGENHIWDVGWGGKGGEQLKGSNLWIWKGRCRFWGAVNEKDIDLGFLHANVEGMLQSFLLHTTTFWEVPAIYEYFDMM